MGTAVEDCSLTAAVGMGNVGPEGGSNYPVAGSGRSEPMRGSVV